MNIPAWQIVGWAAVRVPADRWLELGGFELTGHACRVNEAGRRVGNTLWSTDTPSGKVGLAWEWCEAEANVIVMTDPMSIMSNVCLTSEDRMSNEFERVLHLNNAIYQLPWQKRLLTVVNSRMATPAALALAA